MTKSNLDKSDINVFKTKKKAKNRPSNKNFDLPKEFKRNMKRIPKK